MVLPTAAQVAAVIAAATPWFEAFVALAAFAGLRLGEAAGRRSATSTSSHDSWMLAVRCSAVVPVRSRCERRSTVASEPCSWRTDCSTCSPDTSRPIGPVRIPDGGCSSRAGQATAPEHRRLPMASSLSPGERRGHDSARPPPLLRVRPDRGRLRRRDGAASTRPRESDDDAEHVRTPVAVSGRPHPAGCRAAVRGGIRRFL